MPFSHISTRASKPENQSWMLLPQKTIKNSLHALRQLIIECCKTPGLGEIESSFIWVFTFFLHLFVCCCYFALLLEFCGYRAKFFLFLKFLKSLFWDTKRVQVGEGQRYSERESQAGSMLLEQSLTQSLIPRTVRSWPEPRSRLRHLISWAARHPYFFFLLSFFSLLFLLTSRPKHN